MKKFCRNRTRLQRSQSPNAPLPSSLLVDNAAGPASAGHPAQGNVLCVAAAGGSDASTVTGCGSASCTVGGSSSFPRSSAWSPSGRSLPPRITSSTRRFALRPSAVALLCDGRFSPRPITASRAGIHSSARKQMHDTCRTRRRQLPVRRERRRVDRTIIGVTFDADGVRERLQRVRQLLQNLLGRRRQRRDAAREQNVGADLDFDPLAMPAHRHELAIDEIRHRLLDLVRHARQFVTLLLPMLGQSDRLDRALRLPVDHRLTRDIERESGARADLLLADLDRLERLGRTVEGRRPASRTGRGTCPRSPRTSHT